ncbi:hypothetical protein BGZ99_007748 [Dissophora globulifera]|uniref:Uncharacterized protein n=1 Tax=Dissophora globulifera TaxID=979702 RepID=A0A9P6UQC9_9FUNG|nr:hypothetical protein BGZ99_007748 [Dissophora globulifera]
MTMLLNLQVRIRSMSLTFVLGFLLCIFQSSESILVKLAGNRPDPHPSSAKLLFLSELLKLIISYTLLCVETRRLVGTSRWTRCCRRRDIEARDGLDDEDDVAYQPLTNNRHSLDDPNDDEHHHQLETGSSPPTSSCSAFPSILLFAVPGAIYFFNNNLTFVLLSLMPAPTYVVLSNLKILTTGLFSYWFLHRLLTTPQWISLGILFLSTAVSQIDLDKSPSLSISLQAFLLMLLLCALSATASVFSEYVMKERFQQESIHLQNIKLYMFGILFNGITYALTLSSSSSATGFLADMAPVHYMIILAYASLGLVTSAIIKFSGSITKVYASSMSMFFAALVSWLLHLNDHLTPLFFVGCLGCCFALHLYYRVPSPPPPPSLPCSSMSSPADASSDVDENDTMERRDSCSSSNSSTTLANSLSSSPAKSSPNLLSSVKVVDQKEYFSLGTFDDHDDHDEEPSNLNAGR